MSVEYIDNSLLIKFKIKEKNHRRQRRWVYRCEIVGGNDVRLKLPEEFIVEDQNGCDVTLRSFIQLQRMHVWLGLKLPEEFIMEDVRLPIVYYPHGNGLLSGALAVGEPLCKEGE
ncbi:hypothetical protein HELRODRAFT_163348 [Helobdella robusta]|uniref:Uncharacterized protein n=1 Tax=Helobdella robusta TaxID=6412 RepID=T1ETX9_HELRO|nr:hypothetical protein HELRODRAFT_163348 [Helobdella robusta]ESN96299.1 hypothetical protein HELRODRAFT_163348 [Helobdella robusta]